MTSFAGKTFLVTGGGSGMGLATARRLLADGANVAIAGRGKERLDAAVDALAAGERVLAVPTDVARVEEVEALATAVRGRFGRLDGVFANAGIASFNRAADVTEDDFDQLVAVNFKGVYFTVVKSLPLFDAGGSIVVNGSWLAHKGLAFTSVYAATKAAIVNLTRTLAADLADRGIRVNAVSPGYITTEMFDSITGTEEAREACRAQVALGRLGTADDVAGVVAFLLSEQSSYVTGQELRVDGGSTTSVPL